MAVTLHNEYLKQHRTESLSSPCCKAQGWCLSLGTFSVSAKQCSRCRQTGESWLFHRL